MSKSGLLTIGTATPLLPRVDALEDFTIPSTFFEKSLAARAEAEESSRLSSAEDRPRPMAASAEATCATTCRSRWKKQPLVWRKKSRCANSARATSVTAAAPPQARAQSPVRFVAVEVRWSARADFSKYRKPARAAVVSV